MCNICKIGYKLKYAGKGLASDQRFGYGIIILKLNLIGIYFTPDYKKSLEYFNSENNKKKTLLLNKVIMGR